MNSLNVHSLAFFPSWPWADLVWRCASNVGNWHRLPHPPPLPGASLIEAQVQKLDARALGSGGVGFRSCLPVERASLNVTCSPLSACTGP